MVRGRRALGWGAVVVGSLIALVALVVAVLVGPDNRIESGPHGFTSKGAAVATAPAALAWTGVTVEVSASAQGRPVFVGVGHDVDVADYLHGTTYTRVDSIDVPWSTTTTQVAGDQDVPAPPGKVDFWLVSDVSEDDATVRFPRPESAVDVVVMDAEGKPGFSPDVTVSVVEKGLFLGAVGLLVLGLGIGAAGVLLVRNAPRRGRRRAARSGRRRPRSTSGPRRHLADKTTVSP
jgi:hypothetical protein